jgi:integrase
MANENSKTTAKGEKEIELSAPRARGTGRIFAREGTNSLWIQYSRDGRRYRESAHTTDVKHAERLLQKRLGEIASDEFLPPKSRRVRVNELAQDFLLDYAIQQHKSLDDAEARWNLHLKPFFAHRRAKDVGTDLLKRYVAQRQQDHAANATINRELAALKRMFNLARQSSPPKVVRVPVFPRLPEENIRRGFVEDAQYEKLAAACAKVGLWMRALFEVGYNFGWRLGELTNLRVRHIDLASRTVSLDPFTTKNDEPRTAVMTGLVYALLQQCVAGKQADAFVFTRPNGKRIGDFRGTWAKVCKEAGVEGLLFHDLRRTAVRNMVRSGIPERVAMSISGHKARSVFDRYHIVSDSDLREAAIKLDQRRKPAETTIESAVEHAVGVDRSRAPLSEA